MNLSELDEQEKIAVGEIRYSKAHPRPRYYSLFYMFIILIFAPTPYLYAAAVAALGVILDVRYSRRKIKATRRFVEETNVG